MVAGAALIIGVGCVEGSGGTQYIRNCPVISNSGSMSYDLSYDVRMESDCPVTVSYIGEPKDIAGILYDDGTRDIGSMKFEVVDAKNNHVHDRIAFLRDVQGRWMAAPDFVYAAARVARSTSEIGTSAAWDFGKFEAFKSGATEPVARLTLQLQYRHAFRASISGPDLPLSNSTQTWTVSPAEGTPPFAFEWYRSGSLVSTTDSYTGNVGTEDFAFRIHGTDATGWGSVVDFLVDVDGIRVSMTGPATVYASEGGGTWSASARGGTGQYVFDWYTRPPNSSTRRWVGSGPSWTGYPGEHQQVLQVVVTNGTTHVHETSMAITGIGSDDGSCMPEPPAIRCD